MENSPEGFHTTRHVEERQYVILDVELPVIIQQRLVQHDQQLQRVRLTPVRFCGHSLTRIRSALGDDAERIAGDVAEISRGDGALKLAWAPFIHDMRLLRFFGEVMPSHWLNHVPRALRFDISDLRDQILEPRLVVDFLRSPFNLFSSKREATVE